MTDHTPSPDEHDHPERLPDLGSAAESDRTPSPDSANPTEPDRTPSPDSANPTEADQAISDAFSAFRESHPTFTPPGVAEVFAVARVRNRRRRTASALAAAAVVVVLAGTVGLLNGVRNDATTPSADHRRDTHAAPTATQSTPPSTSTPPQASPPRRPGRPTPIHRIDLRNVTVHVGAIPTNNCAGGSLTFRDGESTDASGCIWRLGDGTRRYADIDGATGDEVVTTIAAGPPQSEFLDAVIAFRSDGRGGVDTMNYVFIADHIGQRIGDITIRDDGAIGVDILDSAAGPQRSRSQTRYYEWAAKAFEQIEGPTQFPGDTTDPSPESPTDSPPPTDNGPTD